MSYKEYLNNFNMGNPEIIVDNKIAAMKKSIRKNQLQEAINEFSSALYIDPLFHEAMLMLAHCLRDPLVGQTDRADRLCQIVLSESPYKYFRILAKSMLAPQQDTIAVSPMVPQVKKHHVMSSRSAKPRISEAISAPQPTVVVQFAPVEDSGHNHPVEPEYNRGKTGANDSSPAMAKAPQAYQSNNFKKTRIRIEETQLERHIPTGNGMIFLNIIPSTKTIFHRDFRFFGTSVAICEDIAVIASPWANQGDYYHDWDKYGALFLFKRDGNRWSYECKLISGRPSLQFGRAVDISESRIIAGAPFDNYKGPVRIKDFHNIRFESSINPARLLDKLFQRGYLDTHKMVTDQFKSELNDRFMRDFPECTAEDLRKIIKILKASQSRESSGSAYILEKNSNGWQRTAILSAVDACSKDRFGRYVAISNDHAVIAASGSVYFFQFTEGQWTQTVKKFEGQSGLKRGPKPVDIMGRYAICAADSYALIFFWDGNQWTQQAILQEDSSATHNREYFGSAVAMGADFAVVSNTMRRDVSVDPQNQSIGTVYVYKRDGSNWPLWATLTGELNGHTKNFGESVAISGSNILVAAPSYQPNEAAVYLYEIQDKRIIHHGRVGVAGNRISNTKLGKTSKGFGCAVALDGQSIVVGAARASHVDDQGRKAYEGGAGFLFEWDR
jgi:predicted dinucleotide-binding enzyme